MLRINLDTYVKNIALFNKYGDMVRCINDCGISIDDLSKGTYIVNISTSKGLVQNRFIKS